MQPNSYSALFALETKSRDCPDMEQATILSFLEKKVKTLKQLVLPDSQNNFEIRIRSHDRKRLDKEGFAANYSGSLKYWTWSLTVELNDRILQTYLKSFSVTQVSQWACRTWEGLVACCEKVHSSVAPRACCVKMDESIHFSKMSQLPRFAPHALSVQ